MYQVLFITVFWILFGGLMALYKCVTYDPVSDGFIFIVPQSLTLSKFILINLIGPAIGGIIGGSIIVFYLNESLKNVRYVVFLAVSFAWFIFIILALNSLVSYFFYHREAIHSSARPIRMAVELLILDPYAIRNISSWMVVVLITLLGLKVYEKYGPGTFLSLLLGHYHRANEVFRVVLFVDLNDSTTLAEQLGHIRFFEVVRDFFCDITDPVLNSKGVIYQYVGDEVIITWSPAKAFGKESHAMYCCFRMREALEKRATYYQQKYGLKLNFKAAMHSGLVVAGEMGVVKREIVYSGDILNTTARMMELCNVYKEPFIISQDIVGQLPQSVHDNFVFRALGNLTLRGKAKPVALFGVSKAGEVI